MIRMVIIMMIIIIVAGIAVKYGQCIQCFTIFSIR